MRISDKPDLPLLQPRTSPSNVQQTSTSPLMLQSTWASIRANRSKLRSVGSVIGWVLLGSLVSSVFPTPKRLVDYSNSNSSMHAVNDQVDLMAARASTGCGKREGDMTKVQKNKGSGWFLGGNDPEHVVTSLPEVTSIDDLPTNWDWRDYNRTGIGLTTTALNQMVPRACGSCWAFATISALSDRIRIARFKETGRLGPEVLLSPQVLLDCGMRSFGSCYGGDPRYAHKWIHENGIVDWTCNPYIASHPSFMGGGDCALTQCHTCALNGECFVVEEPVKYRIFEYGTLNFTTPEEFELQAMNEVYHRGPIVVSMYSHSPEYRKYKGGYILRDATKYTGTSHVVSIVGWGTDTKTGIKYWVVRNSDGTNWGDQGFFLAERGVNIYNMETHGAWAVPIV
uniref:Peptidase C1A papain C-terminal domain-containing protein n=1 Tax=Hyaloperonospora arabidopsidis (strain Emoy2) TaxID=559515 RepID=M4BKW8_HYAAE